MQVYIADTFKQTRIQTYVVRMLCQYGLHLLSQCIHVVVGLGRQQIEEYCRYPGQQVVIAFVLFGIDNRVVEGGLFRIVNRFLYLLVISADAFHEGFLKVLEFDAVKGHRIMRCPVRLEKRVFIITHTNAFSILACKDSVNQTNNKINLVILFLIRLLFCRICRNFIAVSIIFLIFALRILSIIIIITKINYELQNVFYGNYAAIDGRRMGAVARINCV